MLESRFCFFATISQIKIESMPSNRALRFQFVVLLACFAVPSIVWSQDSEFGRRQVEQMLADRPDMKEVIGPEHPVYQWVVDGFQGKYLGQRVYWNASSPRTGRAAEHAIPYGNYPPYISISGGAETTPVDKWAAVVFELHNLQNFESFTRLAADATTGKVKADEYAVKCVMLEYDAQLRTQKLFAANPLPESPHGRDHWYNAWVKSELLSAEEFRAKHAVPGDTHCNYDYFKNVYATRIAPFMPGSAKPSMEPTP